MKSGQLFKIVVLFLFLTSFNPVAARFLSKTIPSSKFFRAPYHMFLFKTAGKAHTNLQIYASTDHVSSEEAVLDLRIAMYTQQRFMKHYEDSNEPCSTILNYAAGIAYLNLDLQKPGKQVLNINLGDYGVVWDDNTENVHFVLFDCYEEIKRKSQYEWKLKLEIDVPQRDGYLNHAEVITYYCKILSLLAVIGVLVWKFKDIKREIYSEYCDTNYAFMIIVFGVLFKLVSLLIDILELHLLKVEGTESPVIHFFAKATEMVSSYLVMLLILFLANGWTIFFQKLDDMELFLPISVALGVLKLIMVGLSRLVKEDQHFFHAFDGWVGFVMIIFNFVLFTYYCYLLYDNHEKILADKKIKQFYTILSVITIWYFCTFPVSFTVTYFVDSWKRSAFIEISNTVSQLISAIALTWLLTAKGKYSDIADFNLSLPSLSKNHKD